MTLLENYRSIARRSGYEKIPPYFQMCPSLAARFNQYAKEHDIIVPKTIGYIPEMEPKTADTETFLRYYDHGFKEGTVIDMHGVAHEPGSEYAFHMTRMHHPMDGFDSVEQIESYPLPDYSDADEAPLKAAAEEIHKQGLVASGDMQCTIWEQAWYMRGMENLMADMMMEDPMAEVLLDRVTANSIRRAEAFARNGADILFLGDDIGMQNTIMMSENLYCTWIQPRLKKVIDAAKAINPELIVFYHSCGYITPMIPHLIDAGIDVLNPIQPECMDFGEIHARYGDRLSFHGTIGTQTTMPFGTPDDVRREVFKNLEIAGDKGGLFVAPTHLLEPEVPVENVLAYLKACEDFK